MKLIFNYRLVVSCCLMAAVIPVNAQPTDKPAGFDSTDRYYIYKPPGFSEDKKYPLFIFLDPMARGGYPVSRYAGVADSLKIILAGSRQSKNFDPSSSGGSIRYILNALNSKGYVDTSAVFLVGFSGGARAATAYANDYEEIKGVIACGAGLAGPGLFGKSRKIPLAGIIGYGDMNFEEMLSLKDELNESNNPNFFSYHNAGHQWPPLECMATAVNWILIQKQVKGNDAYGEKYLKYGVMQKDSGLLYPAWLSLNEIRKLDHVKIQTDSILGLLEKDPALEKDKKAFMNAINEERDYLDEFTILFNNAIFTSVPLDNKEAFREKAGKIKSMLRSKQKYYPASATRCLDFSRRLCVEYYSQFVAGKNFEQADKAAEISSYFNPPTPLPRYRN